MPGLHKEAARILFDSAWPQGTWQWDGWSMWPSGWPQEVQDKSGARRLERKVGSEYEGGRKRVVSKEG